MYTVNAKEASTDFHPVHHSTITIAYLQWYVIGSKLSTQSVTELNVTEIFMSVSLPSLFELYTREEFNIYLSIDKTINKNSAVIHEFC